MGAEEEDKDVVIELDSDVVWSWYSLSSSLRTREVRMRDLAASSARLCWAVTVHTVAAAMLWAVFLNSSYTGLAGGRVMDEQVQFDVYLKGCEWINTAELVNILEGKQAFWKIKDRLWMLEHSAETIFAQYNDDQPDNSKHVKSLCSESGCQPTAITAVNGVTNTTTMEEIIFSFLSAFCNVTSSSRRADATAPPPPPLANENHYQNGGMQTWEQMSDDQRRYWTYLGWDQVSFDANDARLCANPGAECIPQPLDAPGWASWDELEENEQFAAAELGWKRVMWDAGEDPREYLRITCFNYLERNGMFAFVQICAFTVMSLCCVSEYRNFITGALFVYGIEKRATTRTLLGLVSVMGYLVVPAFVQCASALVIFEAGDELAVLMDSLALLFILEMNNYFQFAHNPSSTQWKLTIPQETYIFMDKVRDWFGRLASVSIIVGTMPLGSAFTLWPSVLIHPLWIFNPVHATGPAVAFICCLVSFYIILVVILLKLCGRYSSIIKAANTENAVAPLPTDTADLE